MLPTPVHGQGILPEEGRVVLILKKETELSLERGGVSVSGRGNRIRAQSLFPPLPSHVSVSWVPAIQSCDQDEMKPRQVMAQDSMQREFRDSCSKNSSVPSCNSFWPGILTLISGGRETEAQRGDSIGPG